MLILGIETSCDETAVAVVKDGRKVLSNIIFSSISVHKRYGGVVPDLAVRAHLQKINFVFKKARVDFKKIDAIAVTYGPGLIGALLIGVSFAKGLSLNKKIPLIKINHLLAHLYSPFLISPLKSTRDKKLQVSVSERHKSTYNRINFKDVFPAIGLVVSGGHSGLVYLKNFENYQLLGQTRDDAAGEAFDKVAKVLNLGYPGGPIIDKLARKGKANIKFNCAALKGSFDFSFSGIKTAVLYKVRGSRFAARVNRKATCPQDRYKPINANRVKKADIAASFQKAVVDILVEKAFAACLFKKCKNLVLGGGVTANSYFRKEILKRSNEDKVRVFYPSLEFCTDNAAMVAGLAYHLKNKKYLAGLELKPCANLDIG